MLESRIHTKESLTKSLGVNRAPLDELARTLDCANPNVAHWLELLKQIEINLRRAMPKKIKAGIEFRISDSGEYSAFVQGCGSNKAFIVIDKKILTEAKTVDAIAAIVLHEMRHILWAEDLEVSLGSKSLSRLQEWWCDYVNKILVDAGYQPKEATRIFSMVERENIEKDKEQGARRHSKSTQTQAPQNEHSHFTLSRRLIESAEMHGAVVTRIDLIEGSLAALVQERPSILKIKATPLEDLACQNLNAQKHQTYVDEIKEKANFKKLSAEQKIDLLTKIIKETSEETYNSRAQDLLTTLREIASTFPKYILPPELATKVIDSLFENPICIPAPEQRPNIFGAVFAFGYKESSQIELLGGKVKKLIAGFTNFINAKSEIEIIKSSEQIRGIIDPFLYKDLAVANLIPLFPKVSVQEEKDLPWNAHLKVAKEQAKSANLSVTACLLTLGVVDERMFLGLDLSQRKSLNKIYILKFQTPAVIIDNNKICIISDVKDRRRISTLDRGQPELILCWPISQSLPNILSTSQKKIDNDLNRKSHSAENLQRLNTCSDQEFISTLPNLALSVFTAMATFRFSEIDRDTKASLIELSHETYLSEDDEFEIEGENIKEDNINAAIKDFNLLCERLIKLSRIEDYRDKITQFFKRSITSDQATKGELSQNLIISLGDYAKTAKRSHFLTVFLQETDLLTQEEKFHFFTKTYSEIKIKFSSSESEIAGTQPLFSYFERKDWQKFLYPKTSKLPPYEKLKIIAKLTNRKNFLISDYPTLCHEIAANLTSLSSKPDNVFLDIFTEFAPLTSALFQSPQECQTIIQTKIESITKITATNLRCIRMQAAIESSHLIPNFNKSAIDLFKLQALRSLTTGNQKESLEIAELIIFGEYSDFSHPILNSELRECAIKIYCNEQLKIFGLDHREKQYSRNLKKCLKDLRTRCLKSLSPVQSSKLYSAIARRLELQKELSFYIKNKILLPSTSKLEMADIQVRGVEAAIHFSNQIPEQRDHIIDYLVSARSHENTSKLILQLDPESIAFTKNYAQALIDLRYDIINVRDKLKKLAKSPIRSEWSVEQRTGVRQKNSKQLHLNYIAELKKTFISISTIFQSDPKNISQLIDLESKDESIDSLEQFGLSEKASIDASDAYHRFVKLHNEYNKNQAQEVLEDIEYFISNLNSKDAPDEIGRIEDCLENQRFIKLLEFLNQVQGDLQEISRTFAEINKCFQASPGRRGMLDRTILKIIGIKKRGTLDFVLSDYMQKIDDKCDIHSYPRIYIGQLSKLHDQYTSLPFSARTAIIKTLLFPPDEKLSEQTFQQVALRVFNKILPENIQYGKESRLIAEKYIQTLPELMRTWFLSGMLAACENVEERGRDISAAERIALILCSLGPGEKKLAQAINSHPLTPDDLREATRSAKTSVDTPARWELWDVIEKSIPQKFYDSNYLRLGDCMGAASYFISVIAERVNCQTALGTLRPFAQEQAEEGLHRMLELSNELINEPSLNHIVEPFRDCITHALNMVAIETNCRLGVIQAQEAIDLYSGWIVKINHKVYRFDTARMISYGKLFKEQILFTGPHFNDLSHNQLTSADNPISKDELRDIAKAILTIELKNILLAKKLDHDRHGGQQKILFGENETLIGMFDHGCLELESPTNEDKEILAKIIFSGVKEAISGKQHGSIWKELTKAISESQLKYPESKKYLVSLERALLALNDYIGLSNNSSEQIISQKDLGEILCAIIRANQVDECFLAYAKKEFPLLNLIPADKCNEFIAKTLEENFGITKNSIQLIAPSTIPPFLEPTSIYRD